MVPTKKAVSLLVVHDYAGFLCILPTVTFGIRRLPQNVVPTVTFASGPLSLLPAGINLQKRLSTLSWPAHLHLDA